MDDNQYMKERVIAQKDWHSKQSGKNRFYYVLFRIIQVVCAACIPFMPSIIASDHNLLGISTGLLGVIIAIATGVDALFNFKDKWIEYRSTAEILKQEQHYYLTKVAPYNVEAPFPILVKRIEAILSEQNNSWKQLHNTTEID